MVSEETSPRFSRERWAKRRQAPNCLHDCGEFFFIYIHKDAYGLVFSGVEWEQFIKAHILDEVYYVVFKHESGLKFRAKIFDTSFCASSCGIVRVKAKVCIELRDFVLRTRHGHSSIYQPEKNSKCSCCMPQHVPTIISKSPHLACKSKALLVVPEDLTNPSSVKFKWINKVHDLAVPSSSSIFTTGVVTITYSCKSKTINGASALQDAKIAQENKL
ncbi:hypothetical protein BUALT_Bualt14G0042000 [Buddleja alternifolia]|uniref:TF-B3 domain-containing protein n=1 Tax=Buddleja alternifolia TaxID=168488 RepID=A0AAV6WHN9_9LAMI|nr:hypothetical protein BUALT_Bualt14G0042000 [Buddleja alternifolia]